MCMYMIMFVSASPMCIAAAKLYWHWCVGGCMCVCAWACRNIHIQSTFYCYAGFDGAFATVHAIQEHFLYTIRGIIYLFPYLSYGAQTLATNSTDSTFQDVALPFRVPLFTLFLFRSFSTISNLTLSVSLSHSHSDLLLHPPQLNSTPISVSIILLVVYLKYFFTLILFVSSNCFALVRFFVLFLCPCFWGWLLLWLYFLSLLFSFIRILFFLSSFLNVYVDI